MFDTKEPVSKSFLERQFEEQHAAGQTAKAVSENSAYHGAVFSPVDADYDPITQKMIRSIANHINRSTGVVDGATHAISAQATAFYVYCSPTERNVCHKNLLTIEESGLLTCTWHPQVLDDFETLKHITIPSGKAFLEKFGVQTLADTVANANERLRALYCGVDWIDRKIREISERWRVGGNYLLLGPKDIAQVEIAATVAQRIEAERINGRDADTLSLDWFGDVLVIERHIHVITLFCEARIPATAKDLAPKFQLASLGVSFQTPLCHFRGALNIRDAHGYVLHGTPNASLSVVRESMTDIDVSGKPPYFLTIQNFRTYQRYINAVIDQGIVIYLGDFPSRRQLELYEKIVDHLPSATPIFHWADVDLAGFRTIVTLQDALFGREVQPFQMGVEAMSHALPDAELINPQKLKKIGFNAVKGMKTVLKELNDLPQNQLKVVKQDCMVLRPPAV